ncbi:MAG TPA: hypothetical protein VGM50_05685 [Gemmatimonadaceae bacterium]
MTTRHYRMLATALGIIATFVLAACGGSSDGPAGPTGGNTAKDPTGNYTLTSIDGKPLPYTLIQSDTAGLFKVDMISGSGSLTADGKYRFIFAQRQTVLSAVEDFVDTLSGTWTLSGTTLTLVDALDSTSDDHADWSNTGTVTLTEFYEPTNATMKVLFTLKR